MRTDASNAMAYLYEPIEPLYRFVESQLAMRGVDVRKLEGGNAPSIDGVLVCELDESSAMWIAARKGERCLAICSPGSAKLLERSISFGLMYFLERPIVAESLFALFDASIGAGDGSR